MNSQCTVSASKNNNTHRTAQLLSVTLDHCVDFYALGAYWMRHTLCVVIFGRTHCVQTVHLIIFCPIASMPYETLPDIKGDNNFKICDKFYNLWSDVFALCCCYNKKKYFIRVLPNKLLGSLSIQLFPFSPVSQNVQY